MCENLKVAVRLRPRISREIRDGLNECWAVNENEIRLLDDQTGKEIYTFDYVFSSQHTNEDLYGIVRPIVQSASEGINGTVFAYGQTSSGKTHSIVGTKQDSGIIPRAIGDLFAFIENDANRKYLIRASFLEIYNEKIKDLLKNDGKDLQLREDTEGNVAVVAEEKVTRTKDELFNVLTTGSKNRQIGETQMNEKSSRSHVIFKIIIESSQIDHEAETDPVQLSNLYFVDLAGSERVAQTKSTGTRFKEGTSINKSLSALSLVIKQLSEKLPYVNFRDSKLTRLLCNALSGNSKTLIVAAITPVSIEDTQSTLLFASFAKTVKTNPRVNECLTNEALIKRHQLNEVLLRKELEEQKRNNQTIQQEKDDKIQELKRQLSNIQRDFVISNVTKAKKAPSRRHTMSSVVQYPSICSFESDTHLSKISEEDINEINDNQCVIDVQDHHEWRRKYEDLNHSYIEYKEFYQHELDAAVDERTSSIKKQLIDLKNELLKEKEKKAKIAGDIDALQVTNAEIEIKFESSKKRFEAREKELLNLCKNVADGGSNSERDHVSTLKARIEEQTNLVFKLESELHKLNSERDVLLDQTNVLLQRENETLRRKEYDCDAINVTMMEVVKQIFDDLHRLQSLFALPEHCESPNLSQLCHINESVVNILENDTESTDIKTLNTYMIKLKQFIAVFSTNLLTENEQNKKLTRLLDAANRTIEALESDNSKMRVTFDMKVHMIEELQNDMKAQNEQIAALRKQIEANELQAKEESDDMDWKEEIGKCLENEFALNEIINDLEAQNKLLQNKEVEFVKTIEDLNMKSKACTDEKNALLMELEDEREMSNKWKQRIENYEQLLDEKSQEILDLEKDLHEAKANENAVMESNSKNDSITALLEEAKTEYEASKDMFTTMAADYRESEKRYLKKIDDQKATITKLINEHTKKLQQLQQAPNEIADLKKFIAVQSKHFNEASARFALEECAKDRLIEELRKRYNSIQNFDSEKMCKEKNDLINKLQSVVDEKMAKIEEYEAHYANCGSLEVKLNEKMEAVENDELIDKLRTELREQTMKIQEYEASNMKALEKDYLISKLKAELSEQVQRIEAFEANCPIYKEKDELISNLNKELREKLLKIQEYNDSVLNSKEKDDLITKLKTELSEMLQRMKEFEALNVKLCAELNELKTSLDPNVSDKRFIELFTKNKTLEEINIELMNANKRNCEDVELAYRALLEFEQNNNNQLTSDYNSMRCDVVAKLNGEIELLKRKLHRQEHSDKMHDALVKELRVEFARIVEEEREKIETYFEAKMIEMRKTQPAKKPMNTSELLKKMDETMKYLLNRSQMLNMNERLNLVAVHRMQKEMEFYEAEYDALFGKYLEKKYALEKCEAVQRNANDRKEYEMDVLRRELDNAQLECTLLSIDTETLQSIVSDPSEEETKRYHPHHQSTTDDERKLKLAQNELKNCKQMMERLKFQLERKDEKCADAMNECKTFEKRLSDEQRISKRLWKDNERTIEHLSADNTKLKLIADNCHYETNLMRKHMPLASHCDADLIIATLLSNLQFLKDVVRYVLTHSDGLNDRLLSTTTTIHENLLLVEKTKLAEFEEGLQELREMGEAIMDALALDKREIAGELKQQMDKHMVELAKMEERLKQLTVHGRTLNDEDAFLEQFSVRWNEIIRIHSRFLKLNNLMQQMHSLANSMCLMEKNANMAPVSLLPANDAPLNAYQHLHISVGAFMNTVEDLRIENDELRVANEVLKGAQSTELCMLKLDNKILNTKLQQQQQQAAKADASCQTSSHLQRGNKKSDERDNKFKEFKEETKARRESIIDVRRSLLSTEHSACDTCNLIKAELNAKIKLLNEEIAEYVDVIEKRNAALSQIQLLEKTMEQNQKDNEKLFTALETKYETIKPLCALRKKKFDALKRAITQEGYQIDKITNKNGAEDFRLRKK